MLLSICPSTISINPTARILSLTLFVILGLRSPGGLAESEPDRESILGRYSIIAGTRGPDDLEQNQLDAISVVIARDIITTLDRDGREIYVARYAVENSSEPWKVTLTASVAPMGGAGTETQGLMMQDDGLVNLIYALPGGAAPTDFIPETRQQLFVMRRDNAL